MLVGSKKAVWFAGKEFGETSRDHFPKFSNFYTNFDKLQNEMSHLCSVSQAVLVINPSIHV